MRFSSSIATAVVLLASNSHAFSLNPRGSTRTFGPLFAATLKAVEEPTGTTVGDTRGAALRLQDVAISRGDTPLLNNIQWAVQAKERWGIVGPNGAGKSTLLGAITGTVRMDSGKALVAPKVRVGYLKQSAVSGSTRTVAEESRSEMTVVENARERLRIVTEKVEAGDYEEATLEEMGEAQEEFEMAGGYQQEQLVDTVLKGERYLLLIDCPHPLYKKQPSNLTIFFLHDITGLGFEPEDSDQLCSSFSGGWQMRIALARLLLSQPSLLLLDSSARDWLGKYIANYDGSVVLVSHDVSLLDTSVNSIAEINGNTLIEYRGCSYGKYLEEKEFRSLSAQAEYERNLEEAARLQSYIDKFGAGTKSASAQSRAKMLDKMRAEGKLDPPAISVVSRGGKPVLVLPPPPKPLGEDLLKVEGASIGHDPNEEPLLTNIDITIKRGMKLLLRGPNGAGKRYVLRSEA
jgi:ATP-binding cassette subfamily F protein 3